jgi:hypothetical protein
MRIQKLTLICASVSIAVLTACGGANMSGAISPRKEKTDKSGAKDASAPAVVTGAYLYCDYSPTDNQGDGKAVGCSVMTAENVRMESSSVEGIDYEAESGGKTYPPSKTNTPIWGALWTSLTKLSSTTFHASVSTFDKQVVPLSCTAVPCRSAPVTATSMAPEKSPKKTTLTGIKGVWPGKNSKWYTTGFNSAGLQVASQPAGPDEYCYTDGKVVSESDAESRMRQFIDDHVYTLYKFVTEITSINVDAAPSLRNATTEPMPKCVKIFNSQRVRKGSHCSVAIVERDGSSVLSALVFPTTSHDSAETQLSGLPACK